MNSGVTDAALVNDSLKGDRRAFGELVDRYQKPIYNLARKTLNDAHDAEDVTQTVFMKAYEHLMDYNPKYKFFSWIYRIAINESINFARRRKGHDSIESVVVEAQEGAIADRDVEREVQHGMMELTPEDRAIVLLKHFEGFTYSEIGFIMDIPSRTVKSRLYTARQRLKDILIRERSVLDG